MTVSPIEAILWGLAASVVVFVVLLPFYLYLGALMAQAARQKVLVLRAKAQAQKDARGA